jgi:hypothetical protein
MARLSRVLDQSISPDDPDRILWRGRHLDDGVLTGHFLYQFGGCLTAATSTPTHCMSLNRERSRPLRTGRGLRTVPGVHSS